MDFGGCRVHFLEGVAPVGAYGFPLSLFHCGVAADDTPDEHAATQCQAFAVNDDGLVHEYIVYVVDVKPGEEPCPEWKIKEWLFSPGVWKVEPVCQRPEGWQPKSMSFTSTSWSCVRS